MFSITHKIGSAISGISGSNITPQKRIQQRLGELVKELKWQSEVDKFNKIQILYTAFIGEAKIDDSNQYSVNIFNDESNKKDVYIEFIDKKANESIYQVQLGCVSEEELQNLRGQLLIRNQSINSEENNVVELNLNIVTTEERNKAIEGFKDNITARIDECQDDSSRRKIINTVMQALDTIQHQTNYSDNKYYTNMRSDSTAFKFIDDDVRNQLKIICSGKNTSIHKSSIFSGTNYSNAAKEIKSWLNSQLNLLDVNRRKAFIQTIIGKSQNTATGNKIADSKVASKTITTIVNDTTAHINTMLPKDVFDNNHKDQIERDFHRASSYNIKIGEEEMRLTDCVNENTFEVNEKNKKLSDAQKKIVPLLINQSYISTLGMSVSMACLPQDIALPEFNEKSKLLFEFAEGPVNTDIASIETIGSPANDIPLTAVNMILTYNYAGSDIEVKVTVYFNNLEVDKIHEAKFETKNSGLFGYKIWPITMELNSESTKVEQPKTK